MTNFRNQARWDDCYAGKTWRLYQPSRKYAESSIMLTWTHYFIWLALMKLDCLAVNASLAVAGICTIKRLLRNLVIQLIFYMAFFCNKKVSGRHTQICWFCVSFECLQWISNKNELVQNRLNSSSVYKLMKWKKGSAPSLFPSFPFRLDLFLLTLLYYLSFCLN